MNRKDVIDALELIQERMTAVEEQCDRVKAQAVGVREMAGRVIDGLKAPKAAPQAAQPEQPAAPLDPYAMTLADLVTPKQLGMIRALGREKGVDYELECRQMHGCKTEELSKKAASTLIEHLQKLEPEFKAKRA